MTTDTYDEKPVEVWLQWYGEEEPDMDDLPATDAVSWHREPVFGNDVGPYVLDLDERLAAATQRAEKAERERDALRAVIDDATVKMGAAVQVSPPDQRHDGERIPTLTLMADSFVDLVSAGGMMAADCEEMGRQIEVLEAANAGHAAHIISVSDRADEEARQRIHEAGVASDAIGLLRDVVYLLGEGHRGVTARRLLDEGATGPEATQAESDAGRIGAQWLAKVAQAEVAACEFLAEVQP